MPADTEVKARALSFTALNDRTLSCARVGDLAVQRRREAPSAATACWAAVILVPMSGRQAVPKDSLRLRDVIPSDRRYTLSSWLPVRITAGVAKIDARITHLAEGKRAALERAHGPAGAAGRHRAAKELLD